MSNNAIDLVITQDAIKQVETLVSKLELADAELLKISKSASGASGSIRNITTPKDVDKAVSDFASLNNELQKQNTIIKGLEAQISKLAQVRAVSNKASAEEIVNNRVLNQNALQQAKAVSNMIGAYEKLHIEHQKAFKDAQNIAVTYGTASDEFKKAAEKANLLDTELKSIDADLGKHTRNVGNYKSGWDGLGNSINQIGREMPAFANSMQTGFMAISNNLPQLFDEINKIKTANAELAAAGEPTKSVLQQVGGALFSWGTLLNIGVTLLTVYGAEIGKWAIAMLKGKEAVDIFKVSQETLNDVQKQGQKDAAQEQTTLKAMLETAKDVNLSYKDREIAVKKLQEQYPYYFESLTKEQIMAGDTAKAEKELSDAILARAKAQAATTKITENQAKIIDAEFELAKAQEDVTKANAKQKDSYDRLIKSRNATGDAAIFAAASDSRSLISAKEKVVEIQKEITSYDAINKKLTEYATTNTKASIGLDYHTEKVKKAAKPKKDQIDLNFKEVESEYALQRAILERQKAEISERMNGDKTSLDEKLKARQEYSAKSIELLNLEMQKELAVQSLKYYQDSEKNKLALKNKEITNAQFLQNQEDLNNRYANEKAKDDVINSAKWQEIIAQDSAFYLKIQKEKRDIEDKTAKLILDNNSKLYKEIADDETKTFDIRQKAFDEWLKLQRKQLDIEKIRELSASKSNEETALIVEKYKELNAELDKTSVKESPFAKMEKAAKEFSKTFASDFANKSGFASTFDLAEKGLDRFGDVWQAKTQLVMESVQEMYNFIAAASQKNNKAELDRLEAQKEVALKYAGEDKEAKGKIEEDYQRKKTEINRRDAKQKKEQALFNIAIDMAQALIGLWAKPGFPAAIPMSIAVGAIGLAQIAAVSSQKLPAYAKGGKHSGGLALINDAGGSNYIETVVTPDGKVSQYQNRNAVVDLPNGSEIFTPEQWREKQIKNMLFEKSIVMNNQQNKSGLSREDMDSVMGKHFAKITTQTVTFDKNGFRSWSESNGNKTIRMENRTAGTGFKV